MSTGYQLWTGTDTTLNRWWRMFEKDGRFYGDWHDGSGKRLRKSFNSRRAALEFESEQKELAGAKTKAVGR